MALCYGSLLPAKQMSLQVFLEWFHRLDAFCRHWPDRLLAMALIDRDQLPRWLPWVSGLALLLVAAQGALGALTVTQLLRFDIVSAHLATALLLVVLLSGTAQMLQPCGGPSATAGPTALRWCWGCALRPMHCWRLDGHPVGVGPLFAFGRRLRLALSPSRLGDPSSGLALLSVLLVLALPSPAPARRLLTFAGVLRQLRCSLVFSPCACPCRNPWSPLATNWWRRC